MSIELEWKSFIQKDKFPTNDGKSTKANFFPKNMKLRNKKGTFSPGKPCPTKGESGEARVHSKITTERHRTQADNKEQRVEATRDDERPTTQQLSYSIPSTRYDSNDKLNLKAAKSTKPVEEENNDERKWTRDVIFEAEQIIIQSEIDNMEVNRRFKANESTDHERSLTEPLGEQLKEEIKLQKCKSSSTPSLLHEEIREMGSTTDKDEIVSNKSSIFNVARKVSRTTSRSLKSLNKLGRSTRIIEKNVPTLVRQQQREEGACALLRAAKNDSVFQIQSLVTHGISTEILDARGWTPLTVALENENIKCAEVLLQMNANAKFVHANGMSILHHITSTGIYKGVKFLLRHGADVNAEDSEGWPAVHYAIKQHHLKCTALLLAAGCDSQAYTQKRVKEYEEVVRTATIGKWKFHWQHKLDIDMGNEIQL